MSEFDGALTLEEGCDKLLCRLPEGFTMRVLVESDRTALYKHWAGLDSDDLMTRFFGIPSKEALLKRAETTDFSKTRMAGVFDEKGELASVAQWARETPEVGESAFSTLPAFRRLGLAKAASIACALEARALGLKMMRFETLKKNRAARELGMSLGGEPEPTDFDDDCVVTWLDLGDEKNFESSSAPKLRR